MIMSTLSSESRFRDARRKALLAGILDVIRRQSSDMLAFDAVRACLNIRGQRAIGLQEVPVKHIIGSEGRYSDFDRRFLPRTEAIEGRWRSIDGAMRQSRDLPPVDLYKISDVYFVRDGNHRVSVARDQRLSHIDAYVTELLVDVPLTPELSVHNLLFKEEYSDFLEWTNLHALRPTERIEFSELGGYLDLVRHINIHRYALSQAQGREIDRDEAVASWYDTVYLPIVLLIREQGVLKRFPERTEADLYRWLIDHRHALGAHPGANSAPADASRAHAESFGRKRWATSVAPALWEAVQRIGVKLE
jgi:hypothetical protein